MALAAELSSDIDGDPLAVEIPDDPWDHDTFEDAAEEYEFIHHRLLDAARRS
jgi:hypothetical protein